MGKLQVFVEADGPSGSGRYWNVTVGIGEEQARSPARGFCLLTSTVGWRTLQQYKGPLLWLTDVGGNGTPKVVIWDSFPLEDHASLSDQGLVAWVYSIGERSLTLDWELTRRLAKDVAASYRAPLRSADRSVKQARERAAEALEPLADGRCQPKK